MEIKTRYERIIEGNRLFSLDNNNNLKHNGGVGSGIKGHTTPKDEKIKAVEKNYKDNIQGKSINRDDLGKIEFNKKGLTETINKSNKDMKLLSKLKDIMRIVERGKNKGFIKSYKKRKDKASGFTTLEIKNLKALIRHLEFNKDFYLLGFKDKKK
jgi:hypothetical protein